MYRKFVILKNNHHEITNIYAVNGDGMESKSVIKKISSEDLDKKLISDTDFTLIDTLTNDHFNRVHIVKSKNACVFEVTFPDQVNNLIPEKNKTIILYGFSEKTLDAVTAAEKWICP